MSRAPAERSIAHSSRIVKASLEGLIASTDDFGEDKAIFKPEAVSDILERFTLWTGTLGGLHEPTQKISLDFRLSSAPEIRQQILQYLDDFQEAIDDLVTIISEEVCDDADMEEEAIADTPSDECAISFGASEEAQILLDVMSQCLRMLFRIAMLVRKASRRDRFHHALQHSKASFPTSFDIDYVEQRHPKLNRPSSRWLAKRLGEAISKRRQFIMYSRHHRGRLGGDIDDDVDAATEKQSSKATTFLQDRYAEKVDANLDDEDDGISLMTASTTFDSETSLALPKLADLSPDDEPFECPICFTLQSFQREKAWRIHAFKDLKAYVCTLGGKECHGELFSDRNAWFDHELRHHRSQYACSLCQQGSFGSRKEINAHIHLAHGRFTEDQLSVLIDTGRRITADFKAKDCPICDEWAEVLASRANPKGKNVGPSDVFVTAMRFKRHVATHQEQLAIFAMPRSSGQSGSVGSNGGRSTSPGISVSNSSDASSRAGAIVGGNQTDENYVDDKPPGASVTEPITPGGGINVSSENANVISDDGVGDEQETAIREENERVLGENSEDDEYIFTSGQTTPRGTRILSWGPKRLAMDHNAGEVEEAEERDKEYHRLHDNLVSARLTEEDAEAAAGRHSNEPATRIAREVKEADERDKEYLRRLREDLVKSGFTEEATEAILKKESARESSTTAADGTRDRNSEGETTPSIPRPTYTRFARKHLSIETLRTYGVEHEIDQDPDYVLIKRWVPEWEQDTLWKHTRELRERRPLNRRDNFKWKPEDNNK